MLRPHRRKARVYASTRGPVGPRAGVAAQCALLEQLVRHVIAHGVDDWARETAHAAVRFFDWPSGQAEVDRAWATLRGKLMRIRDGERQWLRRTEVQRFVGLYVELMGRPSPQERDGTASQADED